MIRIQLNFSSTGFRLSLDMYAVILTGLLAIGYWLVLYYKNWTKSYKDFESRGIPSFPGKFPFGSDWRYPTFWKYSGHIIDEMYRKMKDHPYFGYYFMTEKVLVIRDPEIIRSVLTRNFSHFKDRLSFKISEEDHLNNHLFTLNGDKWRVLRVKLSPTFSSGRMKAMFPLFTKCAEELTNLLLSKRDSRIKVKDVISCFTMDLICSCAFGLETNTITNPNQEIRKIGTDFLKMSKLVHVLSHFKKMIPSFFKRRSATPKHVENYIMKLVGDTVEYREKNGITRNDFLDLLIQLKNKGTVGEDMKDEIQEQFEMDLGLMAAQCFVFFIAGFETASSVQTFCLYELALNEDIQDRLRDEIDKSFEKYGGITYQCVQEMEFLHMVVSETMRKYPTLPLLKRTCTIPYDLPGGHKIEKGETILIPLWSLHHDPQYFPNPDKFDPERFSPGKVDSVKPFTYMPFGEGPRICIGNRFGLLQAKMGVLTVLRHFKVVPCEETCIPLKFDATPTDITSVKGSIILKFVPRSQPVQL